MTLYRGATWRFGKPADKPVQESRFYEGRDTGWLYFYSDRGFVALTGHRVGETFSRSWVQSSKGIKPIERCTLLEITT